MEILDMKNQTLINAIPLAVKAQTGTSVTDLKFIGGGSFGKVFKANLADGKVIAVKAFRTQGAQNAEAHQLQVLSKNTSIKMPEVLFTYSDKETALMGMSFIEGSNVMSPVFLTKNKAQKAEFAKEVIDGMMQWHSVSGEKFGDLKNPQYSTWHDFYRCEKQEPWLKSLSVLCKDGKFSNKKYDLLCKATEIFNNVCEEPATPVLIHADLNIMNIMADPKTFKLTGFIDPCGSIWADREYDLFQFKNMWGDFFGLYEQYKSINKMSEHTDFRVAYYGAMHEAAVRLQGGLVMPLWEDLCNRKLKKAMKKY